MTLDRSADLLLLPAAWLLVLLTAPLLLELGVLTAASWLPRRRRTAAGSASPGTRIAAVIPAHNEEYLIASAVASVKASAAEDAPVYVVAHNCQDSTAGRAREAGATVLVYDDESACGKGYALEHGFARAIADGAEAVFVVDADSLVSPGTFALLDRALAEGAEAVQCRYESLAPPERPAAELTSLAFRAFNTVRARGRSRLGLSAGIFGNGFLLRSSLLERIPYGARSVVEDLEYHLALVSAGRRVVFLPEATVSSELPASRSGETAQRARWEGGRLRILGQWLPRLLLRAPLHPARLAEPLLDLVAVPLVAGFSALVLLLALPIPVARAYAAAGLAILALHVLTAAALGPRPARSLQALSLAPFYILRKLGMAPAILRAASPRAAWVRTARNVPPPSPPGQTGFDAVPLAAKSGPGK